MAYLMNFGQLYFHIFVLFCFWSAACGGSHSVHIRRLAETMCVASVASAIERSRPSAGDVKAFKTRRDEEEMFKMLEGAPAPAADPAGIFTRGVHFASFFASTF